MLIEQAGLSIGAITRSRALSWRALASPSLPTRSIWSKASLYLSGDGLSLTAFTRQDWSGASGSTFSIRSDREKSIGKRHRLTFGQALFRVALVEIDQLF